MNNLYEQIENKIIKQVHISDIHFGAMNPEYQYQVLYNNFINRLYQDNYDLICINGDLFHKPYMAGSSAVYWGMKFIADIVEYCKQYNCTLILLQGTASHDGNQLQLFYDYSKIIDLYIVTECKIINFKGLSILCIPEMYNKGAEYYLKYLNQPIDLTIAHCILDDILPQAKINSQGLNSHAPIFNIRHFINSKLVMSGHIHNPYKYEHFHYCGSPYTWIFGESQSKGFYIIHQDNISGQYQTEFVEIDSIKFLDINIDDKILTTDPDKIIKYLNSKDNGFDNYRIVITVANQNIIEKIRILKHYYLNNKRIKFKVNDIDKFEDNKKEAEDNLSEQCKFILDDSISPYKKLSIYMSMFMNTDIDENEIIKLIEHKNT